jgi:orotate phosphoribosyltransferase
MAPAARIHGSGDPGKRERLRRIIRDRSFRNDRTFTLASGRTSTIFFDLKPTMLDPEGINLLADLVLEKLAGTAAGYIGGLAMGAVPVIVATVAKSHGTDRPLRGFWVRKEQKGHGVMNLIDGPIEEGAAVVIVEDVTTTGGSVMKAIDQARSRGCKIAAVVTVVDRLEGAREALRQQGIDLIALFDRDDFVGQS